MIKTAVLALVIVLLGGAAAQAGSQTFDTWIAGVDAAGATHASTMNDSGYILGQHCDRDAGPCYWLLGMSTRCRPGAKYPVLVNSDAAAQSLELGCTGETAGQAGIYGLVFTDFDAISALIARSRRIAIAFPLKGDQFRVVRFDLIGAPEALAAMRAAGAKPERQPRDTPGDTR